MSGKAPKKQSFPALRLAQSWEDVDCTLRALDIRPDNVCLSIGAGCDASLSVLTQNPAKLIVLDPNPAQIYLLELKVAAYRELSHTEYLILFGSRPSKVREQMFRRCRPLLSEDAQAFWDAHGPQIANGIGSAGSFEKYLALFRTFVQRLVQRPAGIERLFRAGTQEIRERYYVRDWKAWLWKIIASTFFSRGMISSMGKDTAYLKQSASAWTQKIMERTHELMVEQDPAANPFIQWLLLGKHTTALPFALQPDNFELIKRRLDLLEWKLITIDDYVDTLEAGSIDRFYLGDLFESLSHDQYIRMLRRIIRVGKPTGRVVYWNIAANHHATQEVLHLLRPLEALANRLENENRSFLYSTLSIEGLP